MIPDRLVLQLCGVSQGHVDPCLRWCSVSHARMAALPVVEDLDVFEERGLRLALGSKARAMHEFGLESAEEALHRGVVQAVPLSAHRGCDAICLEHLAVVAAGILNPAVGVVDQAPRWP